MNEEQFELLITKLDEIYKVLKVIALSTSSSGITTGRTFNSGEEDSARNELSAIFNAFFKSR